MGSLDEYLKPTYFCDFDRIPEIGRTASRLTTQPVEGQETFCGIYRFVKELPYGLEDWDVSASDTLRKGWGMCLGKTNLLVAMLRSLQVAARYRVYQIVSEGTLWRWVVGQDAELAAQMGDPRHEQDHVVAEVYLNCWETYDPSRDAALERGMKRLGIPLERKPISQPGGDPQPIVLASIDEWAANRQQSRRFRENRQLLFSKINERFDKIRALGAGSSA